MAVTYRVDSFSLSGRSVFSLTGFTSQDFRLTAPFGDYALQGGMSFSPTQTAPFTRANLVLSGAWEGVSFTVSALSANIGSAQTPAYDFGSTIRLSGTVMDCAYLSVILGIGATPFGRVQQGMSYEGMRISWGNLAFCGGTANLNFLFDQAGLDSETISWSVPIPYVHFSTFGLNIRLDGFNGPAGSWLDLLGFSASLRGKVGELSVSGSFSFESVQTFSRGVWSVSGPFFGGTLSSSTSIDETTLLSQAFTWSYRSDGFSVTASPTFEIASFDGTNLVFDIPSVRATIRWDLMCCDGIDVGDLTASVTVGRQSLEQVSVTYSYEF
ncbi:MAG TPA: hypothetical protein VMX15_06270 [Candidatus Heimdallarchaeota archaeon]|nr:hypothetical protein [Candidatus Heimdallarchaeota archaeon]